MKKGYKILKGLVVLRGRHYIRKGCGKDKGLRGR